MQSSVVQTFVSFLVVYTSLVSGHARISQPQPLAPNTYDYNAPLLEDGSDFPCKGLHKNPANLIPVETWAAGSTATFTINQFDIAPHSGGSCQASLSYDQGITWKVLASYEGGCPRMAGGEVLGPNQAFEFSIPADAKAQNVLFAWTWVPVTVSRRELYMNCASITITGSGSNTLTENPDMWIGNMPKSVMGSKCSYLAIDASTSMRYTNPGKFTTAIATSFASASEGDCVASALNGGRKVKKDTIEEDGLLVTSGTKLVRKEEPLKMQIEGVSYSCIRD